MAIMVSIPVFQFTLWFQVATAYDDGFNEILHFQNKYGVEGLVNFIDFHKDSTAPVILVQIE